MSFRDRREQLRDRIEKKRVKITELVDGLTVAKSNLDAENRRNSGIVWVLEKVENLYTENIDPKIIVDPIKQKRYEDCVQSYESEITSEMLELKRYLDELSQLEDDGKDEKSEKAEGEK